MNKCIFCQERTYYDPIIGTHVAQYDGCALTSLRTKCDGDRDKVRCPHWRSCKK